MRFLICTFILLFGENIIAENQVPYAINVIDMGAKNDGSADATQVFQQALDKASEIGGGMVLVPAGTYKILGNLKIPAGVTLQGTFRTPPTSHYPNKPNLVGSVLHAYAGKNQPEAEPFITLAGNNATLAGFIISYPEWSKDTVPPIPYPPAVYSKGTTDVAVYDCCIINPYEAIHFQDSARMMIRNVFGYPSFRGLYIDACYDISRVENCHFWPFGVTYQPNDPYCLWINENGTAFEFARTDWQYVTHTFCFGYGVGYKFSKTKNGACNGSFLGIGADCCRRAVLVEDLQPFGLLITNGEFVGRWESSDSAGIEIVPEAGNGKISLINCAFWGPLDRCIWHRSAKTQLTAIGTNFWEWDINGKGHPAIQVDRGKAIIQGNTFALGLLHVIVSKYCTSAIITGNQAEGGLFVINHAGEKTQMAMNEPPPSPPKKSCLKNYILKIGSVGDQTFVDNWHGSENGSEWKKVGTTKRWSKKQSIIRIPVIPNKEYTLTIDLYIPSPAKHPDNAILLNDEKIISLADIEGFQKVTAKIPAQPMDFIILSICSNTWSPQQQDPSSSDKRQLGIAVSEIQMKTCFAPGKPFILNNLFKSIPK
ncbi:MAG TPA: glycosyl hydrolase family 28-related protein [Candidatus Hydrogenedens sp.]|nr:glycosyl hydrolase family 28-related protein [Candidatus Hydrogenedens sp.]HPP58146.1 glycosyl hydrolase family 28-related protein [Candidatus Hydrogenedens sp.]